MKKLIIGMAAAALLPLSVSVQAKNLCLQDNYGGYFYFKGVKALKRGAVVPLVGVAYVGAANAPASGSAVVLADGSVNYGFSVFSNPVTSSYQIRIVGANNLLEGTGSYVYDVTDGTAPEIMTAVDCKTLPDF
jgi:hypothetical protein